MIDVISTSSGYRGELPTCILDEDGTYAFLQKTISIKFYDLADNQVDTPLPFKNVLVASSSGFKAKELADWMKSQFQDSGEVCLINAESFLKLNLRTRLDDDIVYIVYANLNSIAECEFNNLINNCPIRLIGKFPELVWDFGAIGHVRASKKSQALISKLSGNSLDTKRQLVGLLPQYFLLCLGGRFLVRRLKKTQEKKGRRTKYKINHEVINDPRT